MAASGVFREIRDAFATRPRELATLLAVAVLTIASYGFARPAAESLFVERYGSARLPWAWLGVGAGAVVVTAAYNRAVSRISLRSLWPRVVAAIVATAAITLVALELKVPHAEFALYLWKDLYIVVLVELFWSVANVSFPLTRARWLYGMFLAAGSAGGFCAEVSVAYVATSVGSVAAVAAALPLLITTAVLARAFPEAADTTAGAIRARLSDVARRGLSIVRRSRYLVFLVALVALVQVALTVIDYQYNVALEAYAPDVDVRTGLSGKIYSLISLASIGLQLITGLVVRGLGIPVVLALAPALLLAGSLAFAVHPRFGVIAIVKVASKALDYSLGRAAKELLYIPLSYAEKTEGKAIVDLMSYRVAKALASGLLLWLAAASFASHAIAALVIGLLIAWLVLAAVIGRRFGGLDEDGESPPHQ